MSEEEIQANFAKVVGHFNGVTAALTQVLKAMQAQPGYDHQAFLRCLAVYQVVGEKKEDGALVGQGKSYQETLAHFADATGKIPPLTSRLVPPRPD